MLPLEETPGGPAAGPEQRSSIWPQIYPRLLELIRAHRSTIVFVNSRRLAERLSRQLNELAGEELVRAHHGSLAREQRVLIEEALKEGRLPALVATSSLELGIDMGAVDLVIQVESPLSVARGLQRVGRAGHQVGEPSKGVIFPKYRGDLLEVAVVTKLMHEGAIEPTVVPRNPLDVLAQQIVATAAEHAWKVDELYALVRRAENFAELGRESFEAVLGMLAGQYPADEFAELKPRLVWDRVAGTVQSRRDARTVAVISGGTIPDRGLFPVFLADDAGAGRARTAPDRERGHARRAAAAGASASWTRRWSTRPGGRGDPARRVGLAHRVDRARPRAGLAGAGRARQDPVLEGRRRRPADRARPRARRVHARDGRAVGVGRGRPQEGAQAADHRARPGRAGGQNLLGYLDEEREATGTLPTDRTIVLERFRDELGDWRVCLLTPFGARVHAPWALAIEARLRESLGLEVQPIWSDDGIVVRLPATEDTGLLFGGVRRWEDGRTAMVTLRRWTRGRPDGRACAPRRRPC